METRSQIVQKFIDASEHVEQCFDFEIKLWLEKYEMCKHERANFSEAAFLVISAAKIYGRKVDHLEKIIIEFNRRGAADVAAAAADAKKFKENENEKEKEKEKDKKQQEKVLKRNKSVLKTAGKIEFKPKEFIVMPNSEISLNLDEEKDPNNEEDEFEHIRMKNVFPRINVLQSNLQNNRSFYDVLDLPEKHLDNLETLRDFRIFMDTIGEPMDYGNEISSTRIDLDTLFAEPENYERQIQVGKQKPCNIYLPASYIKETYGVDIPDNSDYLNMLKYNEEVERLNLRNLTIEQLSELKIGTYLNNILHGNKQDCKIPEDDSGIDLGDSICDSTNNQSTAESSAILQSTIGSIGDMSIENTVFGDATNGNTTINNSTDGNSSMEITTGDISSILNTSLEASACETSVMDTTGNSVTQDSTGLEQSLTDNSQTGEQSSDEVNTSGVNSLDEKIKMGDPDALKDNLLDPVVEVRDIFYPVNNIIPDDITIDINGPMKGMLNLEQDKKVMPSLELNIFEIPEKLLRRPKIFKLNEDFDIWLAARKRKATTKESEPRPIKIMKMFNGGMITVDGDSDNEECLGWDEENNSMLVKRNVADIIVSGEMGNDTTIEGTGTIVTENGEHITPEVQNGQNQEQSQINGAPEEKELVDTQHDSVIVTEEISAEPILAEQNKSVSGDDSADQGFSELPTFTESQFGESTSHIDATLPVLSSTVNGVENNSLLPADDDELDEWKRVDEEEEVRNEDMREMIERVSKWHTMLKPVLQVSEQRNNFDIHALGTDIIDLFPEDNPEHEITFSNVLENRDPSYRARYFLSLLLLTNTKNTRLTVDHPELNGKRVCPTDELKLKLTSRTRHYDEVNRIDEHLEENRAGATKRKSMNLDIFDEPEPSTSMPKTSQAKKRKIK